MSFISVYDECVVEARNCIYCFENKVNGKKYVGQAVYMRNRLSTHECDCYGRKKYKSVFYDAIHKYGIEQFELTILEKDLNSKKKMNNKEKYYIEKLNSYANGGHGYNIASGGQSGRNNYYAMTEERREKARQKNREAHLGEKNHFYGKKHTKESRSKMGKSRPNELNPMYGKTGWDNPNSKPIVGFIINEEMKIGGAEIVVFSCMADANRYYGVKSIKTSLKSCKGYKWVKLQDCKEPYKTIIDEAIKIKKEVMTLKEGETIRFF